MGRALRLLLIEDSDDDELLVLRELRRTGYDVSHRRVQSADEMRAALAEPWDLVISDYSLPQFSAPAALAVLKTSGLDIPFIICSGTIGEETAVESLHAGAHDFLLKSRLARLAPAIERGMSDSRARRERRSAEDEVRRLEEQVRQTQKMEAMGRLAGGVAHDFNNILTAIIATADLAIEAPGLPADVKQDLADIRDAGHRAAAITRQLLTFSRKQPVQPQSLDINEVVRRSEPMLRRLVPQHVRLETDLRAEGAVEADPAQLEQVVLNLVVNAGDAMPSGGTLTVATEDVEAQPPGRDHGNAGGFTRFTVLKVTDTGTGMDQATLSQIFEPFFTTKDPGRGTGLGLATVYGIVNQAGGHVRVHSVLGAGTTFEVLLPTQNGIGPDGGRAGA